jgi:hypothetical protein
VSKGWCKRIKKSKEKKEAKNGTVHDASN